MLRARLTPLRLAWLHALQTDEQPRTGTGRVGCDCMRLGWTEWVRDADGKMVEPPTDRLTEEGRAMLGNAS